MWYEPGMKREKRPFQREENTSLKNEHWHAPKNSDQVHGNNLQRKLFRSKARARMPGDF